MTRAEEFEELRQLFELPDRGAGVVLDEMGNAFPAGERKSA